MVTLKTQVLAISGAMALSGCMSMPMNITEPKMQGKVELTVEKARLAQPFFTVRQGDSLTQALRALGNLDGKVYILGGDSFILPGNSAPIKNIEDLSHYLDAHGYLIESKQVRSDSPYVQVEVRKAQPAISTKLQSCKANLSGDVPLGFAVTDICREADLHCTYADPGAQAYAGVLYTMSFSGNCLDALDYLSKKGNLVMSRKGDEVSIRMMETAVIDLGIPLRDRKLALDILAEGRINGTSGASSTGANGSTPGASTAGGGQGTNGGAAGGGKGVQTLYYTDYIRNIHNMLESMSTPFGTWNYLHETGQIFVRDRAEAVTSIKETLNRMARAMQSRFAVTLTLYRLKVSKDRQIEGSVTRAINDKLNFSFGADKIVSPLGMIDYEKRNTKAVVNLLSEWGTIETLDSYDLMLQAGVPQTLKVAKNKEYVRNVSTTSATVTGTVTASVEQANATDGAFIAMQARMADGGRIAVDVAAYINKLDGFDMTQTTTSIVKSQNSFERTFDSLAVVDEGVPYLMAAISQESRDDTVNTLPGLEATGLIGPLLGGYRKDSNEQSYILVVLDARKQ